MWGVAVVMAALPSGIVRADQIAVDGRVVGVAAVGAFVASVLAALVPARRVRDTTLGILVREGVGSHGIARNRRWRAGLMAAQVGLVSVLLVATTLIVISFVRVVSADLGFERDSLLVVRGAFEDPPSVVIQRLRSAPGVASAAVVAAGSAPLVAAGGFGGSASSIELDYTASGGGRQTVEAEYRLVSSTYFDTVGMRLTRGATFGDPPFVGSTPIVVDTVSAERMFPDGSALGRELVRRGRSFRVVGVVDNVRVLGPEQDAGPQVYLPLTRDGWAAEIVVRTLGPATAMLSQVRQTLSPLPTRGSRAPQIISVAEAFRHATADRRFNARVMTLFGLLALFIGAAGV
jgi:hypothetical protein